MADDPTDAAALADLVAVDRRIHTLVADQERHVDRECLNLYAGTNIANPRAAGLLASSIGGRPNLGDPGSTSTPGMAAAEELRTLADDLMKRLFGCRHVELRAPSGSIANVFAFLATARPGDRVLTFSDAAGGHVTHHTEGAAGLLGLDVHDVPFDAARMDVDLDELRALAHRIRPSLIVVAGSLCLFPYDVAGVRAVAEEIDARVLYDAAHMGGLIAGGRFQDPLREGAHLVTGSTYKSFGGPPAGMLLSDDDDLAEAVHRIAFPGMTANFDLARTAALAVAVLDLLEHGPAYASAMIAAAQALAGALAEAGVDVFSCSRGMTESQHVALRGYGPAQVARLAEANILTCTIGLPGGAGIRLGTQELTRWGFGPEHMPAVAALIARVLVAGEEPRSVARDVIALRRDFGTLRFVRT